MLATLGLLILVFVATFFLAHAHRPRGFPPGPTWWPLVGCLPQFRSLISRFGYFHLVWMEFARQYGPLVGLRTGKDRVVLVSGAAVKHVLARDDCDGRPDGFYFRMRTFGERLGIVCMDGPAWQGQRRFAQRHLRQLGLGRDAMEGLILEEVEALVGSVRATCVGSQGTRIALHNLCNVGVLNCIWAVVAGRRFDLRDARLEELLSLVFDFFKHIDMTGGLLYQMPVLRFIVPDLIGYTSYMKCISRLQEFLRKTIKEHQNTLEWEKTRDLIDAFLHKMNVPDLDEIFTENQLLALCMDFFMAGSESTSNSIAFLLLYVLRFPAVQRRAQADLDAVVGRARLPTLADRPQLPYIEAIINEVIRINTITTMTIPHKTTKNCDILGYKVPKDTMLLVSVWSVHMDEEHWGDPEVFRPERFLDPTGQTVVKDEWFMPFGGGKRRCLGEALAKNSMFLFLAALLQNFTLEMAPGEHPPSLKQVDGLTLSPQPFEGIVAPR